MPVPEIIEIMEVIQLRVNAFMMQNLWLGATDHGGNHGVFSWYFDSVDPLHEREQELMTQVRSSCHSVSATVGARVWDVDIHTRNALTETTTTTTTTIQSGEAPF